LSQLIIDAGNSHIKLVYWPGEIQFPDFRDMGFTPGKSQDNPRVLGTVPTALAKDPTKFLEEISNLIPDGKFRSILVSVVPAVDLLLENILPGLRKIGSDGHYPYPHEILNPKAVGADRFCNMAAAVAAGLPSALVVDAGTATTFDLLQNGVFKGGLIAPGMAFAARQLAIKGALLEEVPFETRPFTVGRDTREAMGGGAWLTGLGGVQWTIERLLESYGEMPVILTGGLGAMLPAEGRYYDVFWTLRGAWHLAETANSVAGPEAD